jgi:hypothetical protein
VGRRRIPKTSVGLFIGWLALLPLVSHAQEEPPGGVVQIQEEPGYTHSFVKHVWGYVDPENAEIISVRQLSCLIDRLDKRLADPGQVVVKNPRCVGSEPDDRVPR